MNNTTTEQDDRMRLARDKERRLSPSEIFQNGARMGVEKAVSDVLAILKEEKESYHETDVARKTIDVIAQRVKTLTKEE